MQARSRQFRLGRWFGVIGIIFTLALAACQPTTTSNQQVPVTAATATEAAPTATVAPQATATEMAAPTATAAMAETPTTAAVTPSVTVADQAVQNGTVTIAKVVSSGPGWLVVHADNNGAPGTVIGHTAVKDGENDNVVVQIDMAKATPVLYAMLHKDAGTVGTYEFPGADVPVMVDGKVVTPSFNVTGLSQSGSQGTPQSGATVNVSNNATLGDFLVDGSGMTLYMFTKDTKGVSNCTGNCLKNWPALTAAGGKVDAGSGVDASNLGTITRDDGTQQVTYDGMPLYTYIKDTKAGDTNGQGVGGFWFVVNPNGSTSSSSPSGTALAISENATLGKFLVDGKGMTLYMFTKDTPNTSNCTGGCLQAWPPFLTTDGNVAAGTGVDSSQIGAITRDDGTKQVTYKGQPLYYWAADAKPGDTNGQGVNKVWFVVAP